MIIKGSRVRCANCGMVYNRPHTQKVWFVGVRLTFEGVEFCPGCGSNAYDEVAQPDQVTTVTTTSFRLTA